MDIEIITEETIIDNDAVTLWKLNKGNGAIIIDLNKLLDLSIVECEWLSQNKKYIILQYRDWDSMEYFAITSSDGTLIKKGVTEFEFIEKEELFIILLSGNGLDEEATYYNVGYNDYKMAVINKYGKYVMEPEYNSIKYYDDEDVLYADGNVYTFNGSFIKKDN